MTIISIFTKKCRPMSSIKSSILFLLLLTCGLEVASAQNEVSYQRGSTQLEDILPSSPEASSRVKYADVPFTHSMGATQYSVPLWEVKGRELSVPISLEYCSNGVRLDEIAGVAGLGWTLNAGGCVTRSVVYMPDEFWDGGFRYAWPDNTLLAQLDSHTSNTSTMAFLKKVLWNRIDTNSDRYSYDACGLKGSFIISPSKSVIQLQGPGVKIEPTYASSSADSLRVESFTITGPDGTVYEFACKERGTRQDQIVQNSTIFSGQTGDWSATTAWYLTRITSRAGTESALFSYADAGEWASDVRTRSTTLSLSPMPGASGQYSESVSYNYSHVKSTHASKVLTGISLSGYTVSFAYASESSHSLHTVSVGHDVDNYPRRLTSVTVTSPAGRQLLKAETSTVRHPYDGRILLSGITVKKDGVTDDRWTFSYNTKAEYVSKYSQDWFGYYNGETGRADCCPYAFVPGVSYSLSLCHGAPGSAADASYMMLTEADHDGALTKWTYEKALSGRTMSVGGTTVQASVGVRVKSITVRDMNTIIRTRSFTYADPAATATVLPTPEIYLRTSARIVDNTYPGIPFPTTATAWTYSLQEGPVSDGRTLQQARIWYGTVTEEVTTPRFSPDPSAHRTVYTYSTTQVSNMIYDTASRFPTTWSGEYGTMPGGVSPMAGVESWYGYDGSSDDPLLTGRVLSTGEKDPSLPIGFIYTPVEAQSTSHESFGRGAVLTGYKAVQVMQRLLAGKVYENDIQHYPIYSQTSLGSAPTEEVRYEYLPSGTDTTRYVMTNVPRTDMEMPIRQRVLRLAGSDADRCVETTYADTWTSGVPGWVLSLRGQHALAEPLRRDYITAGTAVQHNDTTRVVNEYSTFGGHLMKSAVVEYRNGVESWREDVISRNAQGRPTLVKSKGEASAAIAWDTDGLYPSSVTRNVPAGGFQPTDSVQVSTFTFIPGIGVSSVTDPSGVTTTYGYDHGGRLSSVTNSLGQTTDRYTYSLLNPGSGRLYAVHDAFRTAQCDTLASAREATWWNTLGMRIQSVQCLASGDGTKDLVTTCEGDYLQHDDVRTWLPYPDASADPRTYHTFINHPSITYYGTQDAYAWKDYENSPRDRVVATSLPGISAHRDSLWRDAFTGFPVLVWQEGSIVAGGTYDPGQLEAEWKRDADGRLSMELRDHAGRTLATSRGDTSVPGQMTRYIYDAGDRLRLVAGAGVALTDTLAMWRYGYDALGRVCSKGVPGAAREYYTYDAEDRVASVTRPDGVRVFTYDDYGRVRESRYTTSGSQTSVLVEEHVYDRDRETWRREWCTGSGTAAPCYATTTFTYDALGRVTRTDVTYPDGQANRTDVVYDFSGNPSLTTVRGIRPGGQVTDSLHTAVTYDLWERPVQVVNTLYENGVLSASDTTVITYDAVGRRSSSTAGPVTEQRTYTVQGWLNTLASLVQGGSLSFSEGLEYGYTGLVSGKDELWSADSPSYGGLFQSGRHEDYSYDYAGRLSGWDEGVSEGETFVYDRRGNLLSVTQRYAEGGGTPQTETYSYSSERLSGYTPRGASSPVSFTHDALGRMTADGSAGTQISYNCQDLPSVITKGDGSTTLFDYLADGTKLSVTDSTGGGLVYRGPFIYRVGAGGLGRTLESVPYEGGRLTPDGVFRYMTDHLGSIRAVVGADGETLALNEFGPYGSRKDLPGADALITPPSDSVLSLRYRFTGKEDLDPDFSVPYTDFGARLYNPVLRRWMAPDKLSEKYYDINPYVYCAGNPETFVDIKGDSLKFLSGAAILAMYNGFAPGTQVSLSFKDGVLLPSSIPDNSDDFFISDLREMATSPHMITVDVSDQYLYRDYGKETIGRFESAPYDYDDTQDALMNGFESYGRTIQGNLGQTLLPVLSKKGSIDDNVNIILNSRGSLNHRTVGMAHEFGHVILYLRGMPSGHGDPGVDDFVYSRASAMSKRLGYDR